MNYVEATYLVVSDKKFDVEKKAVELASDIHIWNEKNYPYDKSVIKKFQIKIVDYFDFEDEDTGEFRAVIKLGFPVLMFTYSISSIISIIFGRISLYGRIKLVDLNFPDLFLEHFKGSNFGIYGLRQKLNIKHEPLLMVTLETYAQNSKEIANLLYQIGSAGADIIKENEAYFDDSLAPFEERIKYCLESKKKAEDFIGRKIIYAPNLTGSVDSLIDKAKKAVDLGVEAFVINVVPYGFDILQRLSEEVEAVFIANPAFSGTLYQSKDYGIESHTLFGKLFRLAGADIVIFPSPYGDYPLIHHHAMEVSEALKEKLSHLNPVFPAPSMGIYPQIVPQLFKDFGNQVVINVDEVPYKHPDGVHAGVKAFRDIIDCTVNGVPLEECISVSPELNKAVKKFSHE